MKLSNININNLFSIKSANQCLEDLGLILVTGHSYDEGSANGAGKSSFARNSITWGLFGQLPGDIKADDVIRNNESACSVEIDFQGVDGNRYKILRSRNPNGLFLHLFNEESSSYNDISFRHATETQKAIDNLLGRTFNTFLQTDVFGQGKLKSFMHLTPTHQREVIESILPVESLSKWAVVAKEEKKLLETEINNIENDLSSLKGKKEAYREQKENISSLMNSWSFEQTKKISSFLSSLKEEEGKQKEINIKVESKQAEFSSYMKENPTSDKRKVSSYIKRLENIIVRINKRKRSLSDRQLALINSPEDICDSCNQPIRDEKIINRLGRQVRRLETKLSNISSRINLSNNRLNEIFAIESTLQSLNEEIENLINSDYEKKIEDIKTEISTLEKTSNPFKFTLKNIRLNIKEIKEEVEKTKEQKNSFTNEKKILGFWGDSYGKKLKALLFSEACPYLTERSNEYLGLLGNEQISTKFSTTKVLNSGEEKEEFNVTVSSKTGGSTYSLLSGGEQQMVNFSVGLALADLAEAQVGGASEIIILDEPFTNLDSRNSENVINFIINNLGKKKSTILFISNEESLMRLIPNRIHVEKRNGQTSIS